MKYISSVPIYLQVVNSIKEKIITGELSPGDKLPSGRELALQYTINPNTAARVYQTLEQEQVCFTRRGLGTFVTEDGERIRLLREEMAGTLVRQFLEGMKRLGITEDEVMEMIRQANN
ncbi:MAG: GntR family transcriptional regulator [Lachnospiraceae bacterium]|nr:GntR family transcriptional regulator [Lachnospiraceae bacterium]